MGGWDLHMHPTFCDGQNTPEEMVQAAIKLGLEGIGFSGHAYMPFHEQGVMSREGTEQYRAEIARLKEKYRGRLKILCGIEQDFWCGRPPEGCFDYVIGSVHFVKKDGQYVGVDHSPQMLSLIHILFFPATPMEDRSGCRGSAGCMRRGRDFSRRSPRGCTQRERPPW